MSNVELQGQAYVDTWWEGKQASGYAVQWKHTAALALLAPEHFPLVDLGAGVGVFLRLVEERFPGADAAGLELSAVAVKEKVCQAPIAVGSLLEWTPPEGRRPRTVAMLDVLEHLHDPAATLRHLAGHADHVLITCPNFNAFQARFDMLLGRIPFQNRPARGGHVFWCQHRALLKMFADCGWEVAAENHLYPKNGWKLARALGGLRPSFFSFCFVFLLRRATR